MMRYLLILPALFIVCLASSQERDMLHEGWRCAPASQVSAAGADVSKPAFAISHWEAAVVPGTVLTTLLENKKVPDPFYGMNNERIPDIFHTGNAHYTYWFAKDFKAPPPAKDGRVWLHLRGVNYGCDVFLNGSKLNDTTHKGMFLRQVYDITNHLHANGDNRLAVIVYPPDPPGNPNGGQGGDGMIAKNVTHQYVAGWDWIQPMRDRNTGIWDKVYLERTGAVNISNPHVITRVPGKRHVTGKQAPATISVSAELGNAGEAPVTGTLRYTIAGKTVSRKVTVAGRSTIEVALPDLILSNPRLWWPNGYGQQHLYRTELHFAASDKSVSDRERLSIGVREITREWNPVTKSSQFLVNGQKIFIKGGNWILSDAMLRLTPARYDAEIRFHRDMNLNLIRIWGGALLERPEFYEACDRYGLLVFQDFWITGDCNGRWNDRMKLESRDTRRLYPDDHELFLRSAADGIKMIRNHPSLAVWCGGNEFTPPEDILKVMKDSLFPNLDGTRWFFDYSNSDSMSMNILGGGGDGPYGIQPIDTFWKFRTYPFNSEIGSVGVGDATSLRRFVPEGNMIAPEYTPATQPGVRPVVKVDSVWNYHKYLPYDRYIAAYGPVTDADDFCETAQLINYQQYRALIEGFSGRMWDWYTGVMIWKTQNPWTALRGQMYDYYLDPNACLYGLRLGSEPVHVMYNTYDGTVVVANNSFMPLKGLRVRAVAWNDDNKMMPVADSSIDVDAASVRNTTNIKARLDQVSISRGGFLQLTLTDNRGKMVSENIYWLPDSTGMYPHISNLKNEELVVSVRQPGIGGIYEVTLSNIRGSRLSFFNRVSLVDADTKKRLLPTFYSDNYISVMPGSQKKIWIEHYGQIRRLMVAVRGWNGREQYFPIGSR